MLSDLEDLRVEITCASSTPGSCACSDADPAAPHPTAADFGHDVVGFAIKATATDNAAFKVPGPSLSACTEAADHAVVSTFDMFSIGIGPSSSHTVGPMRAGKMFCDQMRTNDIMRATRVRCELFGSLACTGEGHGTFNAIIMGLEGESPEDVDPASVIPRCDAIRKTKRLQLRGGVNTVDFDFDVDMVLHKDRVLPRHPNGMRLWALTKSGETIDTNDFYSIGGGFVINEKNEVKHVQQDHAPLNVFYQADFDRTGAQSPAPLDTKGTEEEFRPSATLPVHSFTTMADLKAACNKHGKSVSEIVMDNELVWRSEQEIREKLAEIWRVMDDSIHNGMRARLGSFLPGFLKVPRRAPKLTEVLQYPLHSDHPLAGLENSVRGDWLSCWAIAVNEENACGGRVVTAPTNGAAGIIPAVIKYFCKFARACSPTKIQNMLLTASAIGMLYKRGASISAAEVGCQGEVGVAASMAAAALCEALGGSVDQVENAAEIAMEHSLGLTCDPIGGLVQIPCIERNAMGANKALCAARLALMGDGTHKVSLDNAIATMKQTGHDMQSKYKETSMGGLAVNVPVC